MRADRAEHTCCFLGHRTIAETEELKTRVRAIVERLIVDEQVDTFLFGSKSRFNDLCHELVTALREQYPHIRRIYVRAEFPEIGESYGRYLAADYEDTYYPERVVGAGRAVYVQRNCEMIEQSRFCVVYYDEAYTPVGRKSGTKIAYDYAVRQGRRIYVLPEKA